MPRIRCGLGVRTRVNGEPRGGESDEGGTADEAGAIYTDPDQAAEFLKATGADILACSFGTVHGLYKGEPHLNFDILTEIRKRVKNVPLVMHGGSGVSDDDYRKAINAGIRKVNYYTYGVKYAGEAACKMVDEKRAAKADSVIYWHDFTPVAYKSFRETFEHIVRVFANGSDPLHVN